MQWTLKKKDQEIQVYKKALEIVQAGQVQMNNQFGRWNGPAFGISRW